MPNPYAGQRMKSEHVCSLMRRINALEAGIVSTGYVFDRKWGSSGSGDGQFSSPQLLWVYNNEVYVADQGNHRIQVSSLTGTYSRKWSFSYYPTGVTEYAGEIYVAGQAPTDWPIVRVYNTAGTLSREFSRTGTGVQGSGIVGASGVIYVSVNDHFVYRYQTDGTLLGTFGGSGTGDGKFNFPYGIAIMGGKLYVVDRGNQRVQVFTAAGVYESQFASYDANPAGITEGPSGHVLVTSTTADSICEYDTSGNLLYRYAATGTGDGDLRSARGIAYYGSEIYVAESMNNRIQVFDPVTGSGASQTEFHAYRHDSAISLGTPDGGVSVPSLNGLYNSGFPARSDGYTGAECISQHILDMRNAVEVLANSGAFTNPATSNPYNWTDSSADNLYYVAMGDRTKYGATGGAAYDWTRAPAALLTSAPMDIDIGEIAECVTKLEAA